MKFGLDKAITVAKTQYDAIRAQLVDGIGKGESFKELSERVAFEQGKFADYQSKRIARTETVAASNQGALESYKQTGVEKKAWLATHDDRVRESHIVAEEQYQDGIPVNQDFRVGEAVGSAPAMLDLPEESINCRCALVPVIDTNE
jgi:SPP1 gp7 family putative phage head morphogenesis protein